MRSRRILRSPRFLDAGTSALSIPARLPVVSAALIGFALGMAALSAVSTHIDWLRLFRKHDEFRVVSTAQAAWVQNHGHEVTYFMKPLFRDESTGEISMLVRYPAGQINPPHRHPVAHGMYVLQGKLVTHRGTFGPGTFVWFPADEVVSHGAGPDEDVLVMFMTHDGMRIDYVHPEH